MEREGHSYSTLFRYVLLVGTVANSLTWLPVIMDSVMIVLAMWMLNLFHPALLLGYDGERWPAGKADCMQELHSLSSESSTVVGTDSVYSEVGQCAVTTVNVLDADAEAGS